jgi:hypothetical protein
MGSRSGFDADLDLAELQNTIDIGSGAVPPGVRQTNAATNLGELTLYAAANVSLTNNITTAQNAFATNHSGLTLQPNTAYVWEAQLFVDTGTTTHTTAFGFAVSGTALAAIQYEAALSSVTSGSINTTAPSTLDVAAVTATVLNATSAASSTYIFLTGQLVTGNGVVTLTPQVTFSAGPTGTCQTRKGSYLIMWPVVSQ